MTEYRGLMAGALWRVRTTRGGPVGRAALIGSQRWRVVRAVHLWVVAVALIAHVPVFAALSPAPALIVFMADLIRDGWQ